jgi:hypothetical protein
MKTLKAVFVGLSIIGFSNCGDDNSLDPGSAFQLEDFESAWSHIDSIYPLFDFKNIDWDSIHAVYTARIQQSTDNDFFEVVMGLVGELKDGHANVYTESGVKFRPYTPPRRLRDEEAFDLNVVRTYFSQALRSTGNGTIRYEFVSDSIGYVHFSTFGNALTNHVSDIDKVIDYFSQARGVIIDVRNNGGGGSLVYDPIVGRFLTESIQTGSAVSVMGVRPPATVVPRGSLQYTGPIVVLISGTCFSGAEVFIDRMRQLDYVSIVGDTTAGGGMSSNGDPRHFLPSGGSIRINYEAIFRVDGQPIEWNGVPPDIRIVQTETDIEMEQDKQLEFAVEFLKGNQD